MKMKLVIISHTPHYRESGLIVGWGPTVREIDYVSQLFDDVIHIAPLHSGSPPQSSLPYDSQTVCFWPIKATGGQGAWERVQLLAWVPSYVISIVRAFRQADAVHIRFPAAISTVALGVITLMRRPGARWFKYAGNWNPTADDPVTYRFQRWLLSKKHHRGVVTVNGRWPQQPEHIVSFLNPCLTDKELETALVATRTKTLSLPLHLIFVGRVERAKGVGRIIEVATMLRAQSIDFSLQIVGDGPERSRFEARVESFGLTQQVRFLGWQARADLSAIYGTAHFLVLPTSAAEGWPKVLSEGMAYGVVPIAGAVSSIPQILGSLGFGLALDPKSVRAFAHGILAYLDDPQRWIHESETARKAAAEFTYTRYLERVSGLFRHTWGLRLESGDIEKR